jgi:hypothetical protein
MNLEEFKHLEETIPDFVALYVEEVPIDRIVVSDASQVRLAKGHKVDAIPRMTEQLESMGQLAPITVKALSENADELKDGVTRLRGLIRKGETTVLVSRYHDKRLFKTDAQWFKWQITQNEHLQSSQNSEEDVEAQIYKLHKDGIIADDIQIRYMDDPNGYIAEAIRHLRSNVYKNFSDYQIKSRLEKAVSAQDVPENFFSFDKELALEHFDDYNQIGWNPTNEDEDRKSPSQGEISNNISVYAAQDPSNIRKDVLPNAVTKKKKNPGVEIHVVACVGNLAGFDTDKIKKTRQKMVDQYDFYNIKIDVGNGLVDLFSSLSFCPQVKSTEARKSLIERDRI